MYTDITLQPIADNASYTDSSGTKYPSNFPKSDIAELHSVTETPRPDDTATDKVTGFHIDETYTQVWDIVAKTQAELDQELKAQAYQALNTSDMVALRCIKANVAFPADWQTYVADLRAVVSGASSVLPVQPAYPVGT